MIYFATKARKTLVQLFAEVEAASTLRAHGIARAWLNHCASQRKCETLWALQYDEFSYTVFSTLEDALADRANEEHTTAKVQPVRIAMPTINGEDLIDRINEYGCDHFPCDFGIDEEEGPFGGPSSTTIEIESLAEAALDELTDALSNAFAAWARKHVGFAKPGKASIQAWNFIGPPRRFKVVTPGMQGPFTIITAGVWWLELCPRTIAHGAHNCTLPLGHVGECDPELG